MSVSSVIFDLFGTLVPGYVFNGFEKSLAAMARALGFDYETFKEAWLHESYFERHTGVFSSLSAELEWICESNGITIDKVGITDAIRIRYNFTRSVLVPRPDALDTIKTLRNRGIRIGLISDCTWEVPELWPDTPFAGLFDTIVFSCAVGVKKPDPRIYSIACEHLGVNSCECVYIADGFAGELEGAKSFCMRPFLLLPHNENRSENVNWEGHDWKGETISSLSEILTILEKE